MPAFPARDDEPLPAASAALSDIPPLRSRGTSIVLSFRRRPYRRGICCQLAAPNHPPRILRLILGRWPIQARLWLEWATAKRVQHRGRAALQRRVEPLKSGRASAPVPAFPAHDDEPLPAASAALSDIPPLRSHGTSNSLVIPKAAVSPRNLLSACSSKSPAQNFAVDPWPVADSSPPLAWGRKAA